MGKRKRKKSYLKEPHNYYFWLCTLRRPEEMALFLDKGDSRQKTIIIQALNHLKRYDDRLFKKIDGAVWLNRFMEANK